MRTSSQRAGGSRRTRGRRHLTGRAALAGCLLAAATLAGTAAGAQVHYPDGGNPPTPVTTPTPRRPAAPTPGAGLPVTGGDLIGLAFLGAVTAGTGTVLARRARHRAGRD